MDLSTTATMQGPSRAVPAGRTAAAVVPTVMLAVAAACWLLSVEQMRGMDMGVATRLGSFPSFVAVWLTMMAAMMLPSAIPAASRRLMTGSRVLTAPLFALGYMAVWVTVGIAVYAVYRPHGTVVAGVVVIGAGLYELSPLKHRFRLQCAERARNGLAFGLDCVGSSIGLMAILVVLGVMSIPWMVVIAVLVGTQKFLPARSRIDIPVALAILGLGIVILLDPSSVPGLVPATASMPVM